MEFKQIRFSVQPLLVLVSEVLQMQIFFVQSMLTDDLTYLWSFNPFEAV